MPKTRVGIINVTGYAGAELARLLHLHPEVEISQVTGRSAAGQMLSQVFPHLRDADIRIAPSIDASIDFLFSALPHAASAEAMIPFIQHGIPAIDISADFRLKDPSEYQKWYKIQHPDPSYIEQAVYGLPELHRAQIAESNLIANPGCYPTGTILALAPAIQADIVNPDIISDSKSGVSGAGRSSDIRYNFSEINDNFSAYALTGHRHLPEMTQELSALSPHNQVDVTFVPHLAPMTRGILGTHYATLKDNSISQTQIIEIYQDFYRDEPFVRISDNPPSTKETWGSNQIIININLDKTTDRLIVISALDNLVKGAAGAAVQNMNLMLGIPESIGLNAIATYP